HRKPLSIWRRHHRADSAWQYHYRCRGARKLAILYRKDGELRMVIHLPYAVKTLPIPGEPHGMEPIRYVELLRVVSIGPCHPPFRAGWPLLSAVRHGVEDRAVLAHRSRIRIAQLGPVVGIK